MSTKPKQRREDLTYEEKVRLKDMYNKSIEALKEYDYKKAAALYKKSLGVVEIPEYFAAYAISLWTYLNESKSNDTKQYKEVGESFAKANFNLLNVLLFKKENTKNSHIVLKTFLESDKFFNKTTLGFKDKKKDFFEQIYIQSFEIIDLLHVNLKEERNVAHYTRRGVCEVFINQSPFRLNTVATANDPKEGRPLLRFLEFDNDSVNNDYQAFVGSFIFNPDCLNQFRLYGKENGQEATGVSIVVDPDFFSSRATINQSLATFDENKRKNKREEKINPLVKSKEALFRCIYIDPVTQKIISVGHKEEHVFYREYQDSKKEEEIAKMVTDYQKYIDNVLKKVQKALEKLKTDIHNFLSTLKDTKEKKRTQEVVSELLIHLRYLVKHVAFKEEQECRLIRVEPLKDNDKVKVDSGSSRMYYNYIKLRHIDEKEPKKKSFCYITDVYFAPRAAGKQLLEDIIRREGLKIDCHQSDHPYSS
ncbi:MAG: hypothetical protein ACLVKO_09025 [Dysgonomonas sp.]